MCGDGTLTARLREAVAKALAGDWPSAHLIVQDPSESDRTAAWIHAGGSHHTSLGFDVSVDQLSDFAAMSGTELLVIDEHTRLESFRDQIRWNDLYHHVSDGL